MSMSSIWWLFRVIMQMRDELQAAVRELEAILEGAVDEGDHEECGELPENAADEHAGLGFRCCLPIFLSEAV